jgi:Flp pilus assembly protein TadD
MALARATLAHALQTSGNLSGAITEYREMVRLFPRDAGAHAALGRALLKSGDATGAREAFAEAARLDPKQFEPLYRQQFLAPVAPAPRAVPNQ